MVKHPNIQALAAIIKMVKLERSICTVMAMACMMLLHAAVHWPDVADPSLWPLAVRHAVWIYNHIPFIGTGLSPIDTWSKSRFPLRELHNLHVFGCPVYVLEKRLADGKSIGRWEARSQRYVHVGFSDKHAKTVPLVLNLATGSITPQWNITMDDYFSTVTSSVEELPDFNDTEWRELFGTSTYHIEPEWSDLQEELPLEEPPIPPQIEKSQTIQDALYDPPPTVYPCPLPPLSSSSSFQEESKPIYDKKNKPH